MILLAIIMLALGCYIGYKAGKRQAEKELEIVYTQNALLQSYAQQWSDISSNRTNLIMDVAQHQTQTTGATINTVIHLLHSLESKAINNTDTEQQEKINQLINQAKQLTS